MRTPSATPKETSRLLALVVRLARPGVRMRLVGEGGVVTDTRGKRTAIVAAEVAAALRAGVIAVTGDGSSGVDLTDVGRALLRRHLCAAAERPGGGRYARGGRRNRTAGASAPERPMERRSLVEQLALRMDGRGQALLGAVHVAAAERFCRDVALGNMRQRVTASWSAAAVPERRRRGAPGAGTDMPERIADAQARARAALAALGGALADVVIDVCAYEKGLEAVEADHSWPRGAGHVMLKEALAQLARHYGMIAPERRGRGGIRQWGDDDFRPTAEHWLASR